MNAGAGKAKGSAFENLIGEQFRNWWKVEKPYFTRLPRHRGLEGEYWYPKDFPHLVECKHYKDIDFWQAFSSDNFIVEQWWRKAHEEATNLGKATMLILKKNNYPALCGLSSSNMNVLVDTYKRAFFEPILVLLSKDVEVKFFLLEKLFQMDAEYIKAHLGGLKAERGV